MRETVFNWLTPYLPGAVCLDLFAGSGAFGFEAISRGAVRAVLVDRDPAVLTALRHNATRLDAVEADICLIDAIAFLEGPAEPFDVVFLDPPYTSHLLSPCMQRLSAGGWLRTGAFIYLESPSKAAPVLPSGWSLVQSKTAGQVGYHLARTTIQEESA